MAIIELTTRMLMVKRGGPALHEPTVEALMQSMADVGLINPLTVWRPNGMIPHVLAGRHRLEAARRLGWEDVRCNVLEQLSEEPEAETIEIVENLHRRDIPKAEKDRLIRRYVELANRKKANEVSESDFPKPELRTGGRPKGAASAVASELGMSKQAVNQAVARDRAREAGEFYRHPKRESHRAGSPKTDTDPETSWQQSLAARLRTAPSEPARAALKMAANLSDEDRNWLKTQL